MSMRAPFKQDLSRLREIFLGILPSMEAHPDWYASIYFERKTTRNWTANLRQTQVSDQSVTGAVFRIYDGYTLFEQATDEVDPVQLRVVSDRLVARVKASPSIAGATQRIYRSPQWSERLEAKLEEEIT